MPAVIVASAWGLATSHFLTCMTPPTWRKVPPCAESIWLVTVHMAHVYQLVLHPLEEAGFVGARVSSPALSRAIHARPAGSSPPDLDVAMTVDVLASRSVLNLTADAAAAAAAAAVAASEAASTCGIAAGCTAQGGANFKRRLARPSGVGARTRPASASWLP